jgi:hypothetical protein
MCSSCDNEKVHFQDKKTYMVKDLMAAFGFSHGKIISLIRHEPEVIKDRNLGPAVGKRTYCNWRIPAHVAERIHQRLTKEPCESYRLARQPLKVVLLRDLRRDVTK